MGDSVRRRTQKPHVEIHGGDRRHIRVRRDGQKKFDHVVRQHEVRTVHPVENGNFFLCFFFCFIIVL